MSCYLCVCFVDWFATERRWLIAGSQKQHAVLLQASGRASSFQLCALHVWVFAV